MATADGSILIRTKFDNAGLKQGKSAIESSMKSMTSSILKLGTAMGLVFGVAQIVQFAKASVQAASEMSNAYIGLKSIVEGTGNSFDEANAFIQEYISDGLVPATNAVTAYKNLLMRGYTTDQIEKVMNALKDSSAFGRQSALSLGQAVEGASEGLKNENSLLVDNAGVTKNVAKMWEDYAKTIGVSTTALTKEQKIQAEVNGIMEETRFQTGDAAKVAGTWSGQLSALNVKWTQFMVIIGNGLITFLTPFVAGLNNILTVAIQVGNAMSTVFGWQSLTDQTSTSIATNTADTATSADDITNSTNATNKALKKQVGFFEDINVLNKSTASSVGGGSSVTTTSGSGNSNITDTSNKFTKGLEKLKPFIDAVKNLTDTVGTFLSNVAKGFVDFFEDKLSFITIDGIATAINSFADALGKISPDDAKKIGTSLGEIALGFLAIKAAIAGFTFFTEIAGAFKIIAGYVSVIINIISLLNPAALPAISDLLYTESTAYREFIDFLNNFFATNVITTAINNFLFGVAEMIKDIFLTIFNFDEIFGFEWYQDLIDASGKAFQSVKEAFENKDWLGIGKGIILGIANGIGAFVAFVFEPIIKFIDGIVNAIINGINSLLTGINKLSDKSIGLIPNTGITSTPAWSSINIPKLATGGVIPANKEFMAILGDQKSGTNIEAPLDTIKQALAEVLALQGRSSGSQVVNLNIDGQTFARLTLGNTLKEMNRQGYNVEVLGVV